MSQSQKWLLFAGVVLAGTLIYLLQPILLPFLAGALLAYLGSPIVDRLQRIGLPRTAAVLVVFLTLILLITGLIMLLIPMIGAQIDYLQRQLPEMLAWFQSAVGPWLENRFGLDLERLFDKDRLLDVLSEHWQETGDIAGVILGHVTRSGLAFAGFLLNLALIPIVTFYLLRDWHLVVTRVQALLPRYAESTTVRMARECDEVLSAFLRGQLLVMISLGAIYSIGLWLIGLDLALLIGIGAGLLSIVPYLGTILGIVAALTAAFFQFGDWWMLLLVAALFGGGNLLESLVLTPWLVGDRIGLHPVAVIFAVLAGGQLFGFTGVLLALPVAAVTMVLLRHAHRRYRQSTLYGDTSPSEVNSSSRDPAD